MQKLIAGRLKKKKWQNGSRSCQLSHWLSAGKRAGTCDPVVLFPETFARHTAALVYDEKCFNYKRKSVLPLFCAVFRNHHVLMGVGLVLFWFFSTLFSAGRAQNVVRRVKNRRPIDGVKRLELFQFYFWIYTRAFTGISYKSRLKSDVRLFLKELRFFSTKFKRIIIEIYNSKGTSTKSLWYYTAVNCWCCANRNKTFPYVSRRGVGEERCRLAGNNKRIKLSKRNREEYHGTRFKTRRREEHSRMEDECT